MAYALSDIISEVQSKINDPSFSASDIINYANNTNRAIHNEHQLRYMQSSTNFTTSIGVDAPGSLPADFQMAYNLRITDPSYASKLSYLTFDQFDERYPQPTLTGNSVPYLWYTFANTIHVFPSPAAAYTLQLRYYKTSTNLTSSSQTPDVPEEFRELILLGCLRQAMEKRSRFDVAEYYEQKYEAKLIDFLARYSVGGFQESDAYVVETP